MLGSRPSQPSMGSALHPVRRFSTSGVESDGSLLWTSDCEHHTAGVSKRGEDLSTLHDRALVEPSPCSAQAHRSRAWARLYSRFVGFPHPLPASITPQAFWNVANICPRDTIELL